MQKIASEPFALFIQFPDWQAIREQENIPGRYDKTARHLRDINPTKVVIWGDQSPRFDDRPVKFFDIFLSPSLSEVQPLSVLEALASEVPVVATDSTPGYAELIASMPAQKAPRAWLSVQPLGNRFRQGATARDTSLTADEAKNIADELIAKIRNIDVYTDAQRKLLSLTLIQAGFTEAVMNSKLHAVYEEVIRHFDKANP